MLGVALFFIGAVLMVNGVGLIRGLDGRDTAPFNLLVGSLALFINVLGLIRGEAMPDYHAVAGGLLFAFTYLYLAFVQWFGTKGAGLGWFCLFVAINALLYAATAADVRLILMWIFWSSLWFAFFLALGLGRTLRWLGAYTVFVGVATCWIPGALMLFGRW